jgi:hypothetical protein
MFPKTPAEWCTQCEIMHIGNCENCWGWGHFTRTSTDFPDGIPISARMIRDYRQDMPETWQPCPTCEGTPYGPAGLLLRNASYA